jgi:hypothetical protein
MASDLHSPAGEAGRTTGRSNRSILANALLLAASLVIGLIALELILRPICRRGRRRRCR